jgi:hypothetical protein
MAGGVLEIAVDLLAGNPSLRRAAFFVSAVPGPESENGVDHRTIRGEGDLQLVPSKNVMETIYRKDIDCH